MTKPTNPTIEFNPLDPAFVQNPYPVFAALREKDPVHRSPQGYYVLTRYKDVSQALVDPRLGNAPARHAVSHPRNRERYVCADVANNILPFRDGPAHSGARKTIARVFHEQLRISAPDIQRAAREIFAQGPPRDILGDFATPFALRTICEFFDLPARDADRLKDFSHHFFYLFSPMPSIEARENLDRSLVEFRLYFAGVIAQRRSGTGMDFISRVLRDADKDADDAGKESDQSRPGFTEAELIDTCMLLVADGIENVDSGIANAVLALLENPEPRHLLETRPDLLSAGVEECLRYESPAQFIGRVAQEDLEIQGRPIKKGNAVLLMLASGNRDPEAFENPDRLDFTREKRPHLSFGRGAHACIGGGMVKIQMEAALSTVINSPEMRLDPTAPSPAGTEHAANEPGGQTIDEEREKRGIVWQARGGHRWLRALPVRYDA